jgi:hypothetical protein
LHAWNGSTLDLLRSNSSARAPLPTQIGSGRVWHTAFCPRDAVRRKSEPQFAVVPYVCRGCAPQPGETQASFGGLSSICATCPAASTCAGGLDASGKTVNTTFEVVDSSLTLVQGAMYQVYVRGTVASGRWFERAGPLLQVDTTPPVAPADGARDGVYESNCASQGCNGNLGYTMDVSSAGVWHAGFTEDASGIDYYAYGVSTLP